MNRYIQAHYKQTVARLYSWFWPQFCSSAAGALLSYQPGCGREGSFPPQAAAAVSIDLAPMIVGSMCSQNCMHNKPPLLEKDRPIKVIHCAGHIFPTHPYQLCWSNWDMETAISCRKCSHVAGLINKVRMQKHLKGSVAMCVLLTCMLSRAHQYYGRYYFLGR